MKNFGALRTALIGFAILGLGFGLWMIFKAPRNGAIDPGLRLREELVVAVGPVRPLEARLAGLEYAPLGSRSPVPTSARKVAREIEKSAQRGSSAETLGALAVLKLLGDDENRAVRRRAAIDFLEQATSQPHASAHLWSDLAAVYLESAREGEPWRYVQALEAAWHAVQIDPELPESRFNFALALEKNFLIAEARTAWNEYHRIPGEPEWHGEAATHRNALDAPTRSALWERRSGELESAALRTDYSTVRKIVGEDPFRSRRYAEDALLPGWAEARAQGLVEPARRKLQAARVLGAVLASEGEHMAEGSVASIDRLIRAGDGVLLTSLAFAYGDFTEGSKLCTENEATRGEKILESAREIFERADSPAAAWIDYHLGVCAFNRSDRRRAIEILRGILKRPDVERYPSLFGRAHWVIGLSHMVQGEPAAAADAYEASLSVLERTGALAEISGINHMLAENRAFLGDRRQAWAYLHRGLGLAVADGEPRRLYTGLDKTADAAALEGRAGAAMLFRDAFVREALAQGDHPGVAHAYVRLAETRLQSGQKEEAQRNLERAKDACVRIEDLDERRRREADILVAEGKMLSFDQPGAALSPLSRALEIYAAADNRYPIVGAYLARARALLAFGQTDSAQKDILSGIEEFERQRGEINNEELRIAHFDQARELFDLLIDLQGKGPAGAETAFNSAERMRARVLLDRARGSRAARPLSLREILPRLPAGVSVVAYTSLPERLLVWVLRKSTEPTMVEVPLAARRLEDLVSACRRDIQRQTPEESAPACLMDLQEKLLSPVLSRIPTGDRIVFVPDRSLHRVPFAALRVRKTGRFLVEDHASAVTPSASLYVEGDAPETAEPPSLLVAANPRFDRERFPDLPSLNGAAKEAEEISELFAGRVLVLREESATREAFIREARRHSVLHLGTHALVNPDHPHLSQLLLAPGAGDSGMLTAAEIEKMALPRTRLVFLASCRSGGGALASEGVLSLARSFLAAGVPEVVASLWNLDDKPSTVLASGFYRALMQGTDALSAIRQTQLAAIRTRCSVKDWAALQLFGKLAQPFPSPGKQVREPSISMVGPVIHRTRQGG